PRQADIDAAEAPTLAAALIIDRQCAVLQTHLHEAVAVEAAGAQRVDPGKRSGTGLQNLGLRGLARRGRRWRCRLRPRNRAGLSAGKAGQVAVGLDADR